MCEIGRVSHAKRTAGRRVKKGNQGSLEISRGCRGCGESPCQALSCNIKSTPRENRLWPLAKSCKTSVRKYCELPTLTARKMCEFSVPSHAVKPVRKAMSTFW